MDFGSAIESLVTSLRPRPDGDIIDRLNYCYTSILIGIFALFVFSYDLCGTPIACWFPAYFVGWWEEYALHYCYVQNTYWLHMFKGPHDDEISAAENRELIPRNITHRDARLIAYYQWIPFIFAFSAFFFFVPVLVWRSLNSKHGVFVNTILTKACDPSNLDADSRQENTDVLARLLHVGLVRENQLAPNRVARGYRHFYVASLYLFVKLLYILNVFIQFVLLYYLMDFKSWLWGYEILRDMVIGKTWQESGTFPRVTLCDFEVRELGNLHRHSVQCVLLINMFSEKIFVSLWWWFLLLMFLNVLSTLKWAFALATASHKINYVETSLRGCSADETDGREKRRNIQRFVDKELHTDGLFLLKMISENAGDVVSVELAKKMYQLQQDDAKNLASNGPSNNLQRSPGLPNQTPDPPGYSQSLSATSDETNSLIDQI